ncbi:hypothetical protein KMW28_10180 [Flammeovirga yaeyamensis]|uniref:DUF1700 domain-containing protein n=1 Tax=Flammeovirga yaeyamensis TaxID=367791 RepID=A0AAX1N1U6_9BACT|nr:hypothetical protein [Flammeovirga yaeyamensis]MBB3696480.1 hypothetical protein [Flammeovirga yaeyamensis]NMF35158.1 hypothetical protein [Flammeovirga yaeyamensis]QWG00022.1 hypothetical protein KMW28_10180 [Flammeovirga yaeyamensis]
MTLQKALDYFQRLVSETSNTSEIKVYQEFIRIISSLKERDLSETEIKSIETELARLNLISATHHDKRFYQKALSQFEKYLATTFSLAPKGYYVKNGIALGMTIGLLVGTVFLSNLERSMGIALGISIGMFIGLIIGHSLDVKAVSSGRVV